MTWEEKRVLVTGISGFVGPLLAKYLVKQGAKVYGLTRRIAQFTKPLRVKQLGIEDKIELIEGNLTDISSLGNALDVAEPEVIFHLAAQSYVPYSFVNPLESMHANAMGTNYLLESMRLKDSDATMVLAGSSEEYGLVISSQQQYERVLKKYGSIFPPPQEIPEIPTSETDPLRPMSPYAVSKVASDYATRNYWNTYGVKGIVSRGFNHEGAGRGIMFVTSVITSQIVGLKIGTTDKMVIGNVSAFRDWSHVDDIVKGYCAISQKGKPGEVYNQGSMRTNSVLTYLLWSFEEAGYPIKSIETFQGEKKIDNPTEPNDDVAFGIKFDKTKVDQMFINEELDFAIDDKGLKIKTETKEFTLEFNPDRFRPSEVPILLSDTSKVQKLGVSYESSVKDIIRDQLNYYLEERHREQ
ncbi:MAG: NAD-dependent epimerase/dehydratase family protein [Candidatus Lokiarchaeota archaeon]|nr:NAD-dependent epimerase/dehydratase family protein [Candidatus Lokiarchaeota archaeon]